jgi:hypothetical protein
MERIELPKIVNLRRMQNHHFVERLHIDLYAYDVTDGAANTERTVLRISMHNRLKWINEFVQNACSPEVGVEVRIRFMLNDIKDIHTVRGFRNTAWLMRPHCTLEIVVDCQSEQECQEEEFSRAKTLVVAQHESIWGQCFDYEEIVRCEALAELRCVRKTAAVSPQSREGEAVGEYQEVGAREETSTNEGLGDHEASPASPSTMRIARLS